MEAVAQAPLTCEREVMRRAGILLPDAEDLDDVQVTANLWLIIEWLAMRQTFVSQTDHLSDRQLYEAFVERVLIEEIPDVPPVASEVGIIQMTADGSKDGTATWLTFYATDDERREWHDDTGQHIPIKQATPFDRDRILPHDEVWYLN
jgi:hypothetical protein